MRAVYSQQELALPAVPSTQPKALTQILTGAFSLEYLLCVLVFLSGQAALIRARRQACSKPFIRQVSYYSHWNTAQNGLMEHKTISQNKQKH